MNLLAQLIVVTARLKRSLRPRVVMRLTIYGREVMTWRG